MVTIVELYRWMCRTLCDKYEQGACIVASEDEYHESLSVGKVTLVVGCTALLALAWPQVVMSV